MKPDFIKDLAKSLKERDNPTDLKPSLIGVVKQLEPVIVSVYEGAVLLTEGDNLLVSEWFRFRCNIDKTSALSSDVPASLENARAVKETHSYTGTPCNMPDAIGFLADAITSINTELLALKCDLQLGDKVVLTSLEQTDVYLLVDKVLENVSRE